MDGPLILTIGNTADLSSPEEEVPPALGTVLVVTLWRFVVIPAIVLSMVFGFRKIPSTRAFLQDPVYVSLSDWKQQCHEHD